jgi:phosphoenolpyruvate carboxylase
MELAATIHLLGNILGQVISAQESPALYETEERIRAWAKARRAGDQTAGSELAAEVACLTPDAARSVASAFTVYFDLVNLAEEAYRVRALRERERAQYPAPSSESIAEAISLLKQRGLSADEMAQLLRELRIELVLTAHPTEAKRRTILSKLKRISETLHELYDLQLLPRERATYHAHLQAEITALWLTDRARSVKPEVTDEIRTGLYFVDEIFWPALPDIYADLETAVAEHYPELVARPGAADGQASLFARPWLTLASWIGGDRDGNPNVTSTVTAEALRLHRGLAVEHPRRALQDLSRHLSLSAARVPPSPELQAWLQKRHPLPTHVAFLEKRYANEPYRLALAILADDIEVASQ